MDKLILYSGGLCSSSVCVDKNLSKKEVNKIMNALNPTGISSKWKISKNKTFKTGEKNGCDCDKHPKTRRHYLMNC